MYDIFGNFNSAAEINATADGLLNEGDLENIKVLAKENGIDECFVEMFTNYEIPELCDVASAALGKLEVEAQEFNKQEIFSDWLEYIKMRCMESNDMAIAVRKSDKSLKGCIAELLKWSHKNMYEVDAEVKKLAEISGNVKLGIPGMATAKKIITEYYQGK